MNAPYLFPQWLHTKWLRLYIVNPRLGVDGNEISTGTTRNVDKKKRCTVCFCMYHNKCFVGIPSRIPPHLGLGSSLGPTNDLFRKSTPRLSVGHFPFCGRFPSLKHSFSWILFRRWLLLQWKYEDGGGADLGIELTTFSLPLPSLCDRVMFWCSPLVFCFFSLDSSLDDACPYLRRVGACGSRGAVAWAWGGGKDGVRWYGDCSVLLQAARRGQTARCQGMMVIVGS